MCGIVGIVKTGAEPPVDTDVLAAMRDSLTHRGPDGQGLWRSPDGRAGLAHRRLSIVDTSNLADQPMSNEDGQVWVTFNGEIYNHRALRSELQAKGHRFKTDHSDTEVLVHGYEEWGVEGLLQRLQGMFAFAIYDCKTASLLLARDRVGIKPVYFSFCAGAFIFASEIKALLRYPGRAAALEPRAMLHYLSFMVAPAPLTLFEGVFKLAAGSYAILNPDGRMTSHRWWSPVPGNSEVLGEVQRLSAGARRAFFVEEISRRFESAVEKRLMADVPFGAFLSGGLDSSAIVALMSRQIQGRVNTFTVGFERHTDLNEFEHARTVASHFDTCHHEVRVSEQQALDYLDSLVYQQDEPIADWVCVPLHFVSKLAHDAGVKVVQVGEGADEQFAGYVNYLRYLGLHKYWRAYRHLPGPLQQLGATLATKIYQMRPALAPAADLVVRAARDRELFWTGAPLFWDVAKNRLIKRAPVDTGGDFSLPYTDLSLDGGCGDDDSFSFIANFKKRLSAQAPDHDLLTRMIHSEFCLRLPELLLMRVDKITMSSSLEARVPFLDHSLVELSFDIPQPDKITDGQTKTLLKQAFGGLLPASIVNRPKQGFGAPMKHWLRGELGREVERRVLGSRCLDGEIFDRQYVQQLFARHQANRFDASKLIWGLFNLTAWYDCWIERARS